jgi:hypothetical protein
MAILQQLSCESSTRSTLFQFREGVSDKRNKPHNTAIVHPNELRGLDCRSDVMRWRNQNGAAVFIVRSNAFFTNEILKKEPEVRLLKNSLQQAD